MKYSGFVLLGAWLIVEGLSGLVKINFNHDRHVIAAIALSAGVILLINAIKIKFAEIGLLLLSLWLILKSSTVLFNLSFSSSGDLLSILAITTGIFIIIRK